LDHTDTMPISAPKPCTQCGVLVRDGTSRCEAHKAQAWIKSAPYKRESGRRLQRKRAALFAAEPLCRECSKHGRVALATIRDHIKPLAEGGSDDDGNVQPLCRPCSDAKTAVESARGVRARQGGGV
jgi:5-methylcytosine-specific restriction protein A